MDLGAPVLSLSVGGIASGSVGVPDWRTEERCVIEVGENESVDCGEARGRELGGRCDDGCCTRTGYGDSWSNTIELIDEPCRTTRGGGGFEDNGVSWGCTFGECRSAGATKLVTDSREAPREMEVGERCGRFGMGYSDCGDVRPDPVHEGGALPVPEETEDFRFFLQSDFMLLTGLSVALVRLFLPSSVESSEKRLDGGADTGSVGLASVPSPLSGEREECLSGGISKAEYLILA